MNRYGKIKINLAALIEESGLSKNKLSHLAEMERTQINRYCKMKLPALIQTFWRGYAPHLIAE